MRKFVLVGVGGLVAVGCTILLVRHLVGSSFDLAGQTFYCLFDDAMVSMRYALNVATGHGAVYFAFRAPNLAELTSVPHPWPTLTPSLL